MRVFEINVLKHYAMIDMGEGKIIKKEYDYQK